MKRRIGQLYRLAVFTAIGIQVSCGHDPAAPINGGNNCQTTATPHVFGTISAGALATTDCRFFDGSYIDYYSTSLLAGAYVFTQSSTEFDTYLFLLTPDRFEIGENDDEPQLSTNSEIKAILPAGDFVLGANAYPGSTGAYNLASAAAASSAVTGCEDVFVVRGTSTTQDLQTTDCQATSSYADNYLISLRAGQSITVTMSSSAVDSFLELYSSAGRVTFNDNRSTTSSDAQFIYTSPASTIFIISARSAGATPVTGAYTLTIQ
jgi:predicted secreted protein